MADTWVTLLAADLESTMTASEREDFAQSDVSVAMPDRAVVIASDLVAEIRGLIRGASGNSLSTNPALIPPEFKARALALGRWRLLTTIPGYQPGEARKLEYEKADAFFAKVAEGKIRPQAPDDAPVSGAVGASGSWNSENKFLGRMNPVPRPGESQDGRYANPDAPSDES